MSSNPNDNKQSLPPWLRDVPLPPRPSAPAPVAPAPTAGASALPDWLRDAAADQPPPAGEPSAAPAEITLPGAAAESLPEWLRQPASPPAAAAEALPEWLRDLDEPTPTTPAPAAPAPAAAPPAAPAPADDLPDWLRAVSDPAAQPAAPAPAEPWDAALPPLTAPDEAGVQDLPSWLRDLAPPAELPPEPPTSATPPEPPAYTGDTSVYPNWLGDSTPPAEPPQPPPATESLPGWLREEPAEPIDLPAISPFSFDEAGPASATSQPSWIANDLNTDDTGMPAWLGAASAPVSDADSPANETGMPDWLRATPADSTTPEASAAAVDSPLPAGPSQEPAQSEASTPPDASELPLWMQDRGVAAPAQPPASPSGPVPAPGGGQLPAADDLPAWLRDAVATPDEPAPPADVQPQWPASNAAPATPTAESLPAWLHDAATVPDVPPARPVASPAEDLPGWLHDAATVPDVPPASTPAASPAESLPTWLHDAAIVPDAPPTPPAPPADDLPAWLKPAAPTEPAMPATSAPPPAPPADDLPAWLKPGEAAPAPADDLPPWLRDERGQPLPTAGAPGDANLPTWLRGAPDAAPTPPPAEPAPPMAAAALPMREPQPAPSASSGLVGGIELPPWLRPAEAEPAKEEINPTDARSLDWLTRLGTPDDEPETAAAIPQRLAPPPVPTRSSAQLNAIALLEQLAAAPYPQPAELPTPAAPSIWQRLGVERLLYLALLLALIAALISPAPALLGLNQPPDTAGAEAIFQQINTLGADDVVLVGYEWDARRSGELRPLERAVLDHLIANKVKLVLVSTDSQGSLLLYDLRDRLRDAGYKPSGEDYILLGYKPGAELALRAMAQSFAGALQSDFQGEDASGSILATDANRQLRLNSLADFAMILVLADDASDVQSWMEQAHPSARRADGSFVPFGFLMPAEIRPIVQPYLNTGDVLHLDGQLGALAYQQLQGGDATAQAQLAAAAGQQRTGTLAYLALLLIGAIAVGLHSALTRRRTSS